MDSFGMWWKSNEIIIFSLNHSVSSVWIGNALSIVCSEMLKLSRNNQNIKMFGVPPEHSAIGNIHRDILLFGYYYITTYHSKQLPVGLMVLSDGMVHFLKIEKSF